MHQLPRLLAAVLAAFALSAPSAAAQDFDRFAAELEHQFTIAIRADDRRLRVDGLDSFARRLADQLDLNVEPMVQGESSVPRVVMLDRWDRDERERAVREGVSLIFNVVSAAGKKGKEIQTSYVPIGQAYSGGDGIRVRYTGISYKLKFDLTFARAPETYRDALLWDGESETSWKVSADERESPRRISLAKVVDGRLELTVEDVLIRHSIGPLWQAVKVASHRTTETPPGELRAWYGKLDANAKAEYWRRLGVIAGERFALPLVELVGLGLDEWERLEAIADRSPAEERALDAIQRCAARFKSGPDRRGNIDARIAAALRKLAAESEQAALPQAENGEERRAEVAEWLEQVRSAELEGDQPKRSRSVEGIWIREGCVPEGLISESPFPKDVHATVRIASRAFLKDEKRRPRVLQGLRGAARVVRTPKGYKVVESLGPKKVTKEAIWGWIQVHHRPAWPDPS